MESINPHIATNTLQNHLLHNRKAKTKRKENIFMQKNLAQCKLINYNMPNLRLPGETENAKIIRPR